MAKKYVDAVFRKMNEIDHFVTYQQLPTQYISDGEKKYFLYVAYHKESSLNPTFVIRKTLLRYYSL